MVNHSSINRSHNLGTRKRVFKTRKTRVNKMFPSQLQIPKGGRGRVMRRVVSDTQVQFLRKGILSELKRTRGVEDISSSTTIVSEYEPIRKKRRKTCTRSCDQVSFTTGLTLKCIYKNAHFESESRESVSNLLAMPLAMSSFTFGSLISDKEQQFRSRGLKIFSANPIEENRPTRIVVVTSPDGTTKRIALRKVILMHVQETPAQGVVSTPNVEDITRRISHETPRLLDSDGDLQMDQDCEETNPASTIDLFEGETCQNISNLSLIKSRSLNAEQSARVSQISSKHENSQQSITPGDPFSQRPSTSTSEDMTLQNRGDLPYIITDEDYQDTDEEMSEIKESFQDKLLELKCSEGSPPITNYSNESACCFHTPTTSNPMEEKDGSKSDNRLCAFVVSLCFVLKIVSRLINVL